MVTNFKRYENGEVDDTCKRGLGMQGYLQYHKKKEPMYTNVSTVNTSQSSPAVFIYKKCIRPFTSLRKQKYTNEDFLFWEKPLPSTRIYAD